MTDFDGLLKDFSELMDKPLEEQIKVALTGMFTSMQEKYKEDGIDKMIQLFNEVRIEEKRKASMFTLKGLDTAHAIKQYVIKAMQKCKCGITEIKEYQRQADMYDYTYLLQISQEYLDMLNNMNIPCKVSYVGAE